MNYIQQIDLSILEFIASNFKTSWLDIVMVNVSKLGNHGGIFIVAGLLFAINKKYRILGFSILMSLLLGFIFGNLLMKPYFARVRPYDVVNVVLIIERLSDFSFPSGHTLVAFEFAAAISIYFKKINYSAFLFAILMGFSRLYLYVHYPSDVLAGIFFGIIFGILGYYIVIRIEKFYKN